MTNELQTLGDNGQAIDIFTPTTVFDIERFEQVMRVAEVMARASLIPDHLKVKAQDGSVDIEATRGNCFIVSNQASHWGLDPFAVAQASSLVFGKIVLEGKLIRAVIRKFLGFDLNYAFFGNPGDMERKVYVSDRPLADQIGAALGEPAIIALMDTPGTRITKGTLKKWHTKNKSDGVNDNWAKDEDKMFRERGAREWCREWAPGLMLGVYTPDEFDEVENTSRSNRARDITPSNPLLDNSGSSQMDRFDRETGELVDKNSEAQAGARAKTASARSDASAKSSHRADTASGSQGGRSSTNSSSTSSSQDGDDKSGGSAPSSSQRAPAGVFDEFSSALLRYGGTGNGADADKQKATQASDAFWETKGGKPTHPSDIDLCKKIIGAHLQRMSEGRNVDTVKKDIADIIKNSFESL